MAKVSPIARDPQLTQQLNMTDIAAKDSSVRVAEVIDQSKDAKTTKTIDALDWLAQLVSHIPNKGEQIVRLPHPFNKVPSPEN